MRHKFAYDHQSAEKHQIYNKLSEEAKVKTIRGSKSRRLVFVQGIHNNNASAV